MAGKALNEKRFAEMKGKWSLFPLANSNALDNFLVEAAAKAQVAQQQTVPVSEAQVRERIHLSHVNGIDDYSKLFINLAARVNEEEIKLVVIDNIHAVCENFIKQDG